MDVPAARLTLVRLLVVVSALGPVSHPQVMAAGGRVLRHLTVYEARAEYCGWPSMARTANGDLVVLFCRSEEHLGPDGAILLCRSSDNGKTWARPKVIVDTPLDDRESGCTVLDDGRMLAHVWSTFHTPEGYTALPEGAYEPERVQLCAQGLVLRENGFVCDEGIAYFVKSKKKVPIAFDDALGEQDHGTHRCASDRGGTRRNATPIAAQPQVHPLLFGRHLPAR